MDEVTRSALGQEGMQKLRGSAFLVNSTSRPNSGQVVARVRPRDIVKSSLGQHA